MGPNPKLEGVKPDPCDRRLRHVSRAQARRAELDVRPAHAARQRQAALLRARSVDGARCDWSSVKGAGDDWAWRRDVKRAPVRRLTPAAAP